MPVDQPTSHENAAETPPHRKPLFPCEAALRWRSVTDSFQSCGSCELSVAMLMMDGHADQQSTSAADQKFASGRRWAQDRGGDSGGARSTRLLGDALPFGTNQRYDLVLDLDGTFVRAQCKTGRLRNGVIRYPSRSTRINSRGVFNRGYKGEIEIFLIHCADLGQIYAVPVDEAPTCEGYLRVDPTENGQAKGVRWASDYELPG
jgi:hypothetical protein